MVGSLFSSKKSFYFPCGTLEKQFLTNFEAETAIFFRSPFGGSSQSLNFRSDRRKYLKKNDFS